MSIVTTQQLARFFEQFGKTEVTFTKQVISATGLVSKNVYLKVLDRQWPCVVFSSSMAASRVIVTVKEAFLTALRKANNRLSLRWCFKLPEKPEPITFFVSCHTGGFTPYDPQNPEVQLLTLEFTQRPPDDLISILGTLLDANTNAQRRKEERIPVTPESMKKLGLETRETILTLGGTAHRGILRDLSFGGARSSRQPSRPGLSAAPSRCASPKGSRAESCCFLASFEGWRKWGAERTSCWLPSSTLETPL